ncbi:MAG: vitamin B12-dependent ribonucleotide reductase [Deltaproteobacteria bacterium]|nr:vitamin B12-dependent ribonucleotide reductase [Deltaproteobacteria bacterium]
MDIPFLTGNARLVLERRYLKRDESGRPTESPEDLFFRVAAAVAEGDRPYSPDTVDATRDRFLTLMSRGWFLPNSPTLMNAGRRLAQLSACFVLPVEDSIESIFDAIKYTALIHKTGGGTGFAFSRLRPKNDVVLSTAGVSSGPISFMTVFDAATETVKQGAFRRGANMAVLNVHHPDIEDFISVKDDPCRLNNFNLSVGVTADFMNALEKGEQYDLINPRTGQVVGRLSAARVFERMVASAWKSGEPGIIFLDRMNQANPTPALGEIEATNPCGEQPLLPYESCTLGSINLSAMVRGGTILWDRLKETVHTAVHFLDNVTEVNRLPLPQIEEATMASRKIGLGVMGFADLLIYLGVPYDSDQAVDTAHQVMGFVDRESKKASARLGRERGNFPAYKGSKWDTEETPYMRNATTTTIAPTGTLSLLAGTSSGIEPLFAVAYTRRVLEGEMLKEMHPHFARLAKEQGFFSDELAEKVARAGSVQELTEVPKEVRRLFKTAHDISPLWHVKIQAAFQQHTDNAVSKTVNFPARATREDVAQVFLEAYRAGCKGVTIYRDTSREKQVLSFHPEKGPRAQLAPRPRPLVTRGVTERMRTGCGNLYVTVNEDEKGISEVFAQMGKTGGCASSQTEATGRLISLALRSGVSPDAIIKQLVGIRCPSPAWQEGRLVLSCPDAIAQVLSHRANVEPGQEAAPKGFCPDCGETLVPESGCQVCKACGFSKCY